MAKVLKVENAPRYERRMKALKEKDEKALNRLKGIIGYIERTLELDSLNIFNNDDIQPSIESRAQNIIDFAQDLIAQAKDVKENI